jgi:methionyl-tRNA synthetase
MINIEEFRKVELRTAKVLQVDPHPNADRLWVIQLELGAEKRQIVAGIRQHYTPEQLVGKTIICAANLEPAMLRGVESQGMLLAVRDGEKVVALTTDLPTGSGLLVS